MSRFICLLLSALLGGLLLLPGLGSLCGRARAAAPPAPNTLTPAQGAVLTNRGVIFTWSPVQDPQSRPVHYEFVLFNQQNPNQVAASQLSIDPTGPARQDGYALLAAPLDSAAGITAQGGQAGAGVTFSAGRNGQAALIAGAEAITFPAANRFTPGQGTIELAVKLNRDITAITGYDRFFTYHVNDNEQLSLLVTPDLDAVYGHVMQGGNQHNALARVDWTAGVWHHLAFTWGPEGQRLYLDGRLKATNASTAAPAAGGTTIILGNDTQGFGGIDGHLDDLRISAYQRHEPEALRNTQSGEIFLPGGSYAWKVRALAPGEPGPWSAESSFTVDAQGTKTIALTGATVLEDFRGFGAEWDAMFWQDWNVSQGVGETDFQLAAGRLAALKLPLVRIFAKVDWWEPAEGAPAFDSPELKSLYRQLKVCQELGIEVILVIWRLAPWLPDWMSAPRKLARTIADLLLELKRRGITVVRHLTVVNEPNFELGGTMTDYSTLYSAVSAELQTRGIALSMMGPDESGAFSWFEYATANMGGLLGAFDAHTYDFDSTSVGGMEAFVKERLALMAATPGARGKPFFIGEFGSSNNIDTFTSGDIDTYERGLFSAEGALRAMRAGASGILHWCLHDVLYAPGIKMGYGLWKFKDQGWLVRPIYHAWSLLTRLALPGSTVLETASADPRLVTAAVRRTDGTLALWAINRDQAPMTVNLDLGTGLPRGTTLGWYRYEAGNLPVDGRLLAPAGALTLVGGRVRHTLPPGTLTAYVTGGPGSGEEDCGCATNCATGGGEPEGLFLFMLLLLMLGMVVVGGKGRCQDSRR